MFDFNATKVRENARQATTSDLLDRVTAFRAGMEPEAIKIIEQELRDRGIGQMEIHAHRQETEGRHLVDPQGLACKCSFCTAPALGERWGWHWLWGKVPVFPRRYRYCQDHQPE
jgi:hypothetical protein